MVRAARCDGRWPLADIAFAIAGAAGTDYARFSPACAEIARWLIAQGFLIPRDPATDTGPFREVIDRTLNVTGRITF